MEVWMLLFWTSAPFSFSLICIYLDLFFFLLVTVIREILPIKSTTDRLLYLDTPRVGASEFRTYTTGTIQGRKKITIYLLFVCFLCDLKLELTNLTFSLDKKHIFSSKCPRTNARACHIIFVFVLFFALITWGWLFFCYHCYCYSYCTICGSSLFSW